MKVRPFLTIVMLGLASVLGGTVVLDRAAPRGDSPCQEATRSLDAGMVAAAQKAYASILAAHPGSSCAANGAWDVVVERCTRALALAHSGMTAEARAAYMAILAEDLPYRRTVSARPRPETRPENLECAMQGLSDLPVTKATSR